MTIGEADVGRTREARVQQLLAVALSLDYTRLSSIAHDIFTLANTVEGVSLDELRRARPGTAGEEVRRCEVALVRLTAALHHLNEKVDVSEAPDSAIGPVAQ
jgi:hypothetical protein